MMVEKDRKCANPLNIFGYSDKIILKLNKVFEVQGFLVFLRFKNQDTIIQEHKEFQVEYLLSLFT